MPKFPLQAAPGIKDAAICYVVKFPLCPGVHDPSYIGASHTHMGVGFCFLPHKFVQE